MIRAQAIQVVVVCLATAGNGAAAESQSSLSQQLVGRWESTSFITTNCIVPTNSFGTPTNLDDIRLGVEDKWYSASLVATDISKQTNLIICVYGVQPLTNSTAKGRQGLLDVGLFFTDHSGKEKPIPEASGSGWLGERTIMFGGLQGYLVSYSLTGGVLSLEKFGCFPYGGTLYKVRLKATLKKVSTEPGEPWRADQDSAENGSRPIRPDTNRASAPGGSGR
jgi:hypothetical protein